MRTPVDQEIRAIRIMSRALELLRPAAALRALAFMVDRYAGPRTAELLYDKRPSPEWLRAARAAINSVPRPTPKGKKRCRGCEGTGLMDPGDGDLVPCTCTLATPKGTDGGEG